MGEKTICFKCGFESEENVKKHQTNLCKFCFVFAPEKIEEFKEYINEKIPENKSEVLDFYRKYFQPFGEPQRKGMLKKAELGFQISRPPLGYRFENGILIPAESSKDVENIFNKFLNENLSLTKLAKEFNISVNGLKKILTNFTYVGKVKFNGEIHEGTHEPIISNTLFNHVQNKLQRLGIKKP